MEARQKAKESMLTLRHWGHSSLEWLASDWRQVHEGLEVKLCPAPDGAEVFILCRSAQRRVKEQAMHDRFERRIEQKLESMVESCRKREQNPLGVAQRAGKLIGLNTLAAGLFRVAVDSHAPSR